MPRPGRLTPGKDNRHPLYRRLGADPGPAWTDVEKSSPPELDPRTVQPVASRYTDSAIPARSSAKKKY